MGRELKRVPLDFTWPLDQVWQGYLNPHYAKCTTCTACNGSGASSMARALTNKWYGKAPFKPEDRGSTPFSPDHPAIAELAAHHVSYSPGYYGNYAGAALYEAKRLADLYNRAWSHHLNAGDVAALLKHNRLYDLTHTWSSETGWQPKVPAYVPTPEEVNAWSLSGMGHDSINQWVVVTAECERLGVDPLCPCCKGDGVLWDTPEDKQAANDWEPSEPPTGDGYQIWETVSEGSPISPVFAAPEELAQYMAGKPWGADKGSSYETWLRFILGPGWAPSLVMTDARGPRDGVEALCSEEPTKEAR